MGVMPVAYGLAKIQHGLLQLLLQFVHLLLGGIDLLAKCVGVFFSGFLPGFLRCGEFLLRLGEQALGFPADGFLLCRKPLVESPLCFTNLGDFDGLVRDTAQVRGESNYLKQAAAPLGGVELPLLDAGAVVVLELVVKIVVTLAEGEQ